MLLQEEIDKTRQEIRTDGYSMSIGEWISLYQNDEMVKYELQNLRNCHNTQVVRDTKNIITTLKIS
ncbi:MAG: hypothetical protein KI793_30060 [Rivularia sp. (in: Bacteria)]|nr:hypothetical protein [Rivularia sp. MS3]